MAGLIAEETKREILSRLDIVDFIGEFVKLRKQGTRFVGLCPFHAEKTPSFGVNRERGFYYCFGCQRSGDAIKFLQELQGLDFVEAMRNLAERTGIELQLTAGDQDLSRHAEQRRLKNRLLEINGLARAFFESMLSDRAGQGAREYIEKRGLKAETVARFRLGVAPDSWDALGRHMARHEVRPGDLEQLGLAVARPSGQGHYDRFRNRLMFPIHDLAGRVVGFGGRTLAGPDEGAKYINSPDSAVYHKGEVLFGLYEARQAIRQRGAVLLVEGNIDLLSVSQAGLPHVVAPLGTALTPAQALLLKRFEDAAEVVLVYDGDAAGQAAALKAADLLLEHQVKGRVVTLPSEHDPDTFVRAYGGEALERRVEQAPPFVEFLLEREMADQDRSASGRARVIDKAREVLKRVAAVSDVERDLWIHWLAGRLELTEHELRGYLGSKDALAALTQARRRPSAAGADPWRRKEWQLGAFLLHYPRFLQTFFEGGGLQFLTEARLIELLNACELHLDVATGALDSAGLLEALTDAKLQAWAVRALDQPTVPADEAERAFGEMMTDFQRRNTLAEERRLGDEIKKAIPDPDKPIAQQEWLTDIGRKQVTLKKRKVMRGD